MSAKKGFLSFLKSWTTVSDADPQQREEDVSRLDGDRSYEDSSSDAQNQQNFVTAEMESYCIDKLEILLEKAGFLGKVQVVRREGPRLDLEVIDAGDDAGRIIGKNGATLSALEQLLKSFVFRQFSAYIKVVIDAGEYRRRRFEQIKTKAFKAAETVGKTGRKIALEPMSSAERREIHMLFEENSEVATISEGRGDYRRVVIVRKSRTTS